MSSEEGEDEKILAKEVGSWKGFEYALRKPNATLFNKMLKKVWKMMKNMLLHSKQKDHSILQNLCLWL
jgi:hypothetical protein